MNEINNSLNIICPHKTYWYTVQQSLVLQCSSGLQQIEECINQMSLYYLDM